MSASRFRTLLASLVLIAAPAFAQAADIYGYVDAQGVAHFAAEKLDERYELFYRGGESFDTAEGLPDRTPRARMRSTTNCCKHWSPPSRASMRRPCRPKARWA